MDHHHPLAEGDNLYLSNGMATGNTTKRVDRSDKYGLVMPDDRISKTIFNQQVEYP